METKTCKYCKSEIDKKAKICPNCRKKQKGGILGKVVIALIVLIVLGAVLGGGGDDDKASDSSAKTENTGSKAEDKKADDKETEAKETETEAKGYIEKGESFEAKGLKITVDDIDVNYEPKDNEYGLYDLDGGMKYIAASFTFENIGDDDAYVSISDFDCYADNTSCEQQFLPEDDFINQNLSSGRNVSFATYYAVPEDAESIELEYEANFWTDEKVIIKVQ